MTYDEVGEVECSNDPCRNRATKYFVVDTPGGKEIVPLCDTCAAAYEMGQPGGGQPLQDIDTVPDDTLVCPECQRGFLTESVENHHHKYCGKCGSTFMPDELKAYESKKETDPDDADSE